MSDLIAREAENPDWDGPIVELVEEGRVVGFAYEDEGVLLAEFFADEDSEPWVFEVADLQRALDNASAMLGLDESPPPATAATDTHPVDTLAAEFDSMAAWRGDEDEGFYPALAVATMIRRSEALGLAVVSLEAFTLHSAWVDPIAGQSVDIGKAHEGEPWPMYQAGCNVQAMALLEKWAPAEKTVFSVEVGDPDGDRFVL